MQNQKAYSFILYPGKYRKALRPKNDTAFLNKTSRNLSGGEKKIVETLIITYSDSEFVILDEPFSGISPKAVDEMEIIIKSQTPNKGIIISDHNYMSILNMADDTYLLSDNYLRKVKDLKELQQFNYLPKN